MVLLASYWLLGMTGLPRWIHIPRLMRMHRELLLEPRDIGMIRLLIRFNRLRQIGSNDMSSNNKRYMDRTTNRFITFSFYFWEVTNFTSINKITTWGVHVEKIKSKKQTTGISFVQYIPMRRNIPIEVSSCYHFVVGKVKRVRFGRRVGLGIQL